MNPPPTEKSLAEIALGPPEELETLLAGAYGAHLAILERRLGEALSATGFDGAVVFAGDEQVVFRDDQTYPFRAEPYFLQWVPLTHAPGSFLRLIPGQRPMLVYLQVEDYWHEPPVDPAGYWARHFDICIARSDAEARKLAGSGPRWVGIGAGVERERNAHGPRAARPASNDARVLAHLDYSRAVKTHYELLAMRGAQAAAVRGHLAVAHAFRSGSSELELHQRYLAASAQRETELPYPNIIALNEHSATLHYQRLRAPPPTSLRSLLVDAGAQFNGYAADITRSYSAVNDDFARLIDAMDALQRRVCAEVKPGVDFVALHALAHWQLAALLHEVGIVRCSADEAVAAGLTRAFFPHGLGHLLGLQVHDAGGRLADRSGARREPPAADPYLRLTRVLQPGFVVTIEPGLYFIPALLRAALERHESKLNRSAIERLVPFGGIRIEDDVEVTQDGHRNLSREAFAAAAAVHSRGRQ